MIKTLLLAISFFATAALGHPHECDHADDAKPQGFKLVDEPELEDKKGTLDEISGVAASLRHPGIFYVHNDSGGDPRIFAITPKGQIVSEVALEGAKAEDYEDITTGKCGLDFCVYVGDFGNNSEKRQDLAIYELVEPTELKDKVEVKAKRYGFTWEGYDKKTPNAEGIAFNPLDGHLYLTVKGSKPELHRLPLKLSDKMETKKLCELKEVKRPITALDISLDGRMLVRTKKSVYEYGAAGCDKFLSQFDDYKEKQGEAVAYTPDGFLSISEGKRPKIYRFKRD